MPRVRQQLQNTMEINGFEFGMCFGDVTNCCFFVLQYVAHITNVFWTCCFVPFWNPNRIGSVCFFVVFAPSGARIRNNGMLNVWRAVAQHIFPSMSRLLKYKLCYSHSGCVVSAGKDSNVVWCTFNNGNVGTLRCGLSTVAPSDVKFARCSWFMTRRLRHYCRLCVAASIVWRSLLRPSWFVSSLSDLRLCPGATSRSARAADSDGWGFLVGRDIPPARCMKRLVVVVIVVAVVIIVIVVVARIINVLRSELYIFFFSFKYILLFRNKLF